MHPAHPLVLTVGGLLLGLAAGAVLQRSHFCTMGCISDAVLFGSLRRLRIWALALVVALVGSQALAATGLVDLGRSVYRQAGWLWPGALPGGLLFGFGMVQAGGCVSRNLARLGAGSLKAGTALLAVAAAAVATAWLLPDRPAPVLAAEPTAWAMPLSLALAAALLIFCLRHPGFRRSPADLMTGLLLGALVPLGWLVTSLAASRPDSLNYLALDRPGLLLPLATGTVLGALAIARWRGEFRLERFSAAGDLRRHLRGGLLMGVGGTLALGCTIGQGLTGVATLSPGSLLAVTGMLAGAWWGVKHLETGQLLPRRLVVAPRQQRQSDVADAVD
jgi:uncharacterized membrane protein YedE/YeeE